MKTRQEIIEVIDELKVKKNKIDYVEFGMSAIETHDRLDEKIKALEWVLLSECKYKTIEVVNMLLEDDTREFEHPIPNHIGMIRLVKTKDGICFKQYNEEIKDTIYSTISLSSNTLGMTWREVSK